MRSVDSLVSDLEFMEFSYAQTVPPSDSFESKNKSESETHSEDDYYSDSDKEVTEDCTDKCAFEIVRNGRCDHLTECYLCGNRWDGFAQCQCVTV